MNNSAKTRKKSYTSGNSISHIKTNPYVRHHRHNTEIPLLRYVHRVRKEISVNYTHIQQQLRSGIDDVCACERVWELRGYISALTIHYQYI